MKQAVLFLAPKQRVPRCRTQFVLFVLLVFATPTIATISFFTAVGSDGQTSMIACSSWSIGVESCESAPDFASLLGRCTAFCAACNRSGHMVVRNLQIMFACDLWAVAYPLTDNVGRKRLLGERLYWAYANLAMAQMALHDEHSIYATPHYMVRSPIRLEKRIVSGFLIDPGIPSIRSLAVILHGNTTPGNTTL